MCENLFVYLDVYEMHLILNNDAVGSRLSCIMMQELKPFTPARVTKVPHVSTFLGKTGSVGLEVLDTLGSSIMNLNANSGFVSNMASRGNKLFWRLNSPRWDFNSEGVQLLLSTDTKELLRIDKREELEYSLKRLDLGDVILEAGIQVGNSCWELYCLEHGLKTIGPAKKQEAKRREMAEVLMDFPQLTMTLPDRSEESVMKRTTLVANTSNLMLLVHGQAGSEAVDSGSCQSCAVPKGSLVAVFGESMGDLVLLDDILSAVDAQVASWIISNEILSPLLWLQLLERLSSDLYTIDDSLPFILNILLVSFIDLVGIAIILSFV
ncbi:hypothetical protein Tco_1417963 [Tanacetum coccineum]